MEKATQLIVHTRLENLVTRVNRWAQEPEMHLRYIASKEGEVVWAIGDNCLMMAHAFDNAAVEVELWEYKGTLADWKTQNTWNELATRYKAARWIEEFNGFNPNMGSTDRFRDAEYWELERFLKDRAGYEAKWKADWRSSTWKPSGMDEQTALENHLNDLRKIRDYIRLVLRQG